MRSVDTAAEISSLAGPTVKLRMESGLGGYRIIAHDGRVLAMGSDVAFARQLVDDHNKDVDKNLVTGTKHL